MVTMTEFAAAFGLDEKHDGTWTVLGKVTTVTASKLFVKVGNSSTAVAVERYCDAAVGDIVYIVIENGTARAIARKGTPLGAPCFLGALVQIRQGLFQLDIYTDYPSDLQTGTLIAAYGYAANSYAGKINIGLTHATGGALYVHGAESSASNPITWAQGDVLLLSYRGGTTPYFIVVSKY